jgi:hypothetical protein
LSDTTSNDLPVISSSRQIRWEVARELVPVPEWGCQVWTNELTGEEKDEYQSGMFDVDGSDYTLNFSNNTNRLVVFAARDEAGNRLWPNTKRGVEEVAKLGSAGAERIAEAARRLSKMTKESRKVVAGNSAAGQTGSSNKNSHSPSGTPVAAVS